MATKFGYVERNIENDVNWGEVGKGFADMLVAERDERKAKKEFLDDAMVKAQDGLKEAPLGYNTDFNDRIIELSTNASAYLLAANKDMKAGKITPAEYMRKVQRMNSSADQIFTLTNNYNKLYEQHLNRLDKGVSGEVEQAIFERIDNMTNFNSHDFFIDSTGAIVAAPLVTGEDGVTTIDPSKALSAQAMFNLAQNFVNKVDVEAEAKKSADRLGTFITSNLTAPDYKNKGKAEVINDIRQKEDYNELKESLIDGILDSDLNTASVLTDYIAGYDVVTSEKELSKDPAEREKQVFIDISNGKEGRAVLTESQEKAARERIGVVLEGMINSQYQLKETAKVEKSWSEKQFWWNQSQDRNQDNETLNQLALLYSGESKGDIEGAIQYFKGLSNGKIQDIIRTDDNITVVYKDTKGNKVSSSPLSYTQDFNTFVKTATALTGIKDANKALKSLDLSGNINLLNLLNGVPTKSSFEESINLADIDERPLEVDFQKAYGDFLDKNITTDKSGKEIQNKLKGMGIESEFDAATNQIKIVESKDKATGATSGKTFTVGSVMSINALDSYLRGDATQQARFKNKIGTMGGSMAIF